MTLRLTNLLGSALIASSLIFTGCETINPSWATGNTRGYSESQTTPTSEKEINSQPSNSKKSSGIFLRTSGGMSISGGRVGYSTKEVTYSGIKTTEEPRINPSEKPFLDPTGHYPNKLPNPYSIDRTKVIDPRNY